MLTGLQPRKSGHSSAPSALTRESSAKACDRYPKWMLVRVLFFGVLKDLVGAEQQVLEVEHEASVGDLLDVCRDQTSKQSEVWTRLAVAVNREYASRSKVLAEGDEVALLPPVSGGRP